MNKGYLITNERFYIHRGEIRKNEHPENITNKAITYYDYFDDDGNPVKNGQTTEKKGGEDMEELTVEEMTKQLYKNPKLKKLMLAELDLSKTDPEALDVLIDMLQETDFQPKEFYTVPEAAKLLGVHPNTIYHLEQQRKITYYKPGKKIEIPAAEILRLKQERRAN